MSDTVYLADGFHGDWREFVMDYVKIYAPHLKVRWICPGEVELHIEEDYTPWDLFWVRRAEVTFAYMERDNPSGVGLAVEVAVAKEQGKFVVLVDRKNDRHMGMVRVLADYTTDDLGEGVDYLVKLLGGAGVREATK